VAISPDRSKRPLLVTLIAIYQFSIGCAGLIYFAQTWRQHGGDGRALLIDNPFSYALPVFSAVSFVIGGGVWRLQPWARHVLIGTTGLAIVRGLTRHAMGAWVFQTQRAIAPFIVIDLMIWFALMYYPDIAAVFGERNEEDTW
jgi:hypothetical protein